jgi:hypothetical protein
MRTLRVGAAVALGDGEAVGDSCAKLTRPAKSTMKIATFSSFVIPSPAVAGRNLSLFVFVCLYNKRRLDFARHDKNLDVIAPVHVREKIIAPFAVAQEILIDIVGHELSM